MTYFLKKAILGYSNLFYPLINAWRSHNRPPVEGHREKVPFYLSFDLDYSNDVRSVPQLLRKLSKLSVRASFACIGKFVEMFPEEHRVILEDGHEIVNHTYTHPDNDEINPHQTYRKLRPEEQFEEIRKMQEICEEILGYRPIGFRLPHFGNVMTVDMETLYKNLKALDMIYDSSILKFNVPEGKADIYETCIEGITEFSINSCPYHPYAACDSWHIYRSNRYVYRWIHKFKTFENTFVKLINFCYERQEIINVYLDPMDLVESDMFERIVKYAKQYCEFRAYQDYFEVTNSLGDSMGGIVSADNAARTPPHKEKSVRNI